MSKLKLPRYLKEYLRQGWRAEYTGGQHIKLTHPKVKGAVFTGGSPSDSRRGEANCRANVRRALRRAEGDTGGPS